MIQGYAIYLRTHHKTGKQYGGCVWGAKPNWSPEKACMRRWAQEDREGIRGLFGGFDSTILLTERRGDAPEMSERLYRIRIAVDEEKVVQLIASNRRLNLISPLSLGLDFSGETQRAAGQKSLIAQSRKARAANGRKAAQTHKQNGTGFYSKRHQAAAGKLGGHASAAKRAQLKVGIFAEGVRSRGGITSGNGAVQNQTGIHALGFDRGLGARTAMKRKTGLFGISAKQHSLNSQKAGQTTAAIPGHFARIAPNGGRAASHLRWHIKRGIVSPNCRLCRENLK